eukprot:6859980-Pyramimonas_sp.AAC.1
MEQARRYPLVRAQSLVDDQLLQALGTARLVGEQLPNFLLLFGLSWTASRGGSCRSTGTKLGG